MAGKSHLKDTYEGNYNNQGDYNNEKKPYTLSVFHTTPLIYHFHLRNNNKAARRIFNFPEDKTETRKQKTQKL
jgi:hypothetical protein